MTGSELTAAIVIVALVALVVVHLATMRARRDERWFALVVDLIDRHDTHAQKMTVPLIGDRDRLLNAALSVGDPLAARAVGVMDQAARPRDVHKMMEALVERETAANNNEYVDGDGNPIVPVGLGSNA